jgi:hypothetical protein
VPDSLIVHGSSIGKNLGLSFTRKSIPAVVSIIVASSLKSFSSSPGQEPSCKCIIFHALVLTNPFFPVALPTELLVFSLSLYREIGTKHRNSQLQFMLKIVSPC